MRTDEGTSLQKASQGGSLAVEGVEPGPAGVVRSALGPLERLRAKTVALLMTLTVYAWSPPCSIAAAEGSAMHGRLLMPGLEWVLWNGGDFCRAGDPTIGVLAVNPERFAFRIFYYAQEGLPGPLTLWEWLDRSPALALFNAGQYYPDYSYMGLLVLGGKPIRSRFHHSFQALFAAEPADGQPPMARILDLSTDVFDPSSPAYREVAQSFMLVDRSGAIRVRKTPRVANRTVVAEGQHGRIWIFVTLGGYTLWEFGQMLRSGPFPIRQAMAMDGGFEAQMLVKVGPFLFDNLGTYEESSQSWLPGPSARRPLPTVIAVLPRK